MAFYHTGAYLEAVAEAGKALELEPENPRLKENLEILKELAEG